MDKVSTIPTPTPTTIDVLSRNPPTHKALPRLPWCGLPSPMSTAEMS